MHRPTLADILRRYGPAYRQTCALSAQQRRAWRAIAACRTAELGGVRERCEHCARERYRYRSCGNRHCPQCQTQARQAWRAARCREVLPVPYAHWVFTLPHALNALAAYHARWVFDTLFACASSTLLELAGSARWLDAEPTVTLVLHTWGQDLRTHLHVHALVSCGGLDAQGHWRTPVRGSHFLFPVKAASRLFRGRFIDALVAAQKAGVLDADPARTEAQRAGRLRMLREHDWVVYAKPPAGGPAQVLDYLARYTHRVAISNERILGIEGDQIRLRVRPGPDHGRRTVSLPAPEFIARFMRHVLPRGFKRIRHYGLLAPRHKAQRLGQARAALRVPEPQMPATETAQAFLRRVASLDLARCPYCRCGHWRTVEICPPAEHAHCAHRTDAHRCACARWATMIPKVPRPSGMPATGSRRSRGYACCLQRPTSPIPARAQRRHDVICRARGAFAHWRLIRKDERRDFEAADAIQRASPAHRILSITA